MQGVTKLNVDIDKFNPFHVEHFSNFFHGKITASKLQALNEKKRLICKHTNFSIKIDETYH